MQEEPSRELLKRTWKSGIVIIGIVVVIIAVATIIAASQNYFRNGIDFFSLWLAPHLLVEGKNPYNTTDWLLHHETSGVATDVNSPYFLYPLPLAVILIPLGILPLEYAAVIWTAMSITAILMTGTLILSFRKKRWLTAYIIPMLAGMFLFRPVAETLRLGQLDWLILICLVMGILFYEKQQWLIGGLFFALPVVKPQIGVPLLLFFSLWLLIRRKWSGLIGEGVILSVLFALGWLFNHSWLWEWLGLGINKLEANICCTPTLWGFASLLCNFNGNCGFKLGIVLAGIVCLLVVFLIFRIPDHESRYAIGLSIPAALLISPYLWTYSQMILLIPILLIVDRMIQNHFPYLVVASFPLLVALFSLVIVFISMRIGVDVISSLVPVAVFAVLLWFYMKYTHVTLIEG